MIKEYTGVEMESNLMNAYQTAYEMACERLNKRDAEEISLHTNAIHNKETHTLSLKYLNTEYLVNYNTGAIHAAGSQNPVTTTVKVLILHYLLHARITPLTGKLISFKEIPGGGSIYYQTFQKRAIHPFVMTYANDMDGLYRAAARFQGIKEGYGHASVSIRVFPLIPVTYVLWQGDDEFPASGTILFDESVTSYLPGEDIVLAASFGAYGLMGK
jgi:hypothetical protein